MEQEQQQLLMVISGQQQQQMEMMGIASPEGAPPPYASVAGGPPNPMQAELAEDAKELQEAQQELLNDILKQQSEETDPERLQELFRQQNVLLQQMQQLQNAGFQYSNGIPQPQPPNAGTSGEPQPVPMAAAY